MVIGIGSSRRSKWPSAGTCRQASCRPAHRPSRFPAPDPAIPSGWRALNTSRRDAAARSHHGRAAASAPAHIDGEVGVCAVEIVDGHAIETVDGLVMARCTTEVDGRGWAKTTRIFMSADYIGWPQKKARRIYLPLSDLRRMLRVNPGRPTDVDRRLHYQRRQFHPLGGQQTASQTVALAMVGPGQARTTDRPDVGCGVPEVRCRGRAVREPVTAMPP